MASVTVSSDFGWVILGVAAVTVHYYATGRYVMAARKKHKIQYPDMGSGIYAKKLSDKDWVDFNNAQRAHGNYLEMLPAVLPLALFSGIFQPKITAALCVPFMFGREMYSRGYTTKGPEGRLRGTPFYYLPYLGWFSITVYGALKLVGAF